MLPKAENDLQQDFETGILPSLTYKLDFNTNRIIGLIDEKEALKQAVHLMLSVPRFKHEIYTWDYGSELEDLIGEAPPLAFVKIKNTIEETLMQDDRIHSVSDFSFRQEKEKVFVQFTVMSEYGEEVIEREVVF